MEKRIKIFKKNQSKAFLEEIGKDKDCCINLGVKGYWTYVYHPFFNERTLTRVIDGKVEIYNIKLKCWQTF